MVVKCSNRLDMKKYTHFNLKISYRDKIEHVSISGKKINLISQNYGVRMYT